MFKFIIEALDLTVEDKLETASNFDIYIGLRLDGRKAGELRRIETRLGVFGQADGSAYIEQGNTKVH